MAKPAGQAIVCDASSLISLTDSCFVHVVYFLRKKCSGRFIIPPSVERECVEQPMHMRNYALHAIRLKRAIAEGMIDVVGANEGNGAEELRFAANNLFHSSGTPIRLLHHGEADVLSLALEAGVDNLLMDERTARMLVEDPESLRQHLERELGRPVSVNDGNMAQFSRATRRLRFFRSSELILLAYEKGYFSDYGDLERDAVEASLYKLKYAGCAIGFGEIDEYVRKHIRE